MEVEYRVEPIIGYRTYAIRTDYKSYVGIMSSASSRPVEIRLSSSRAKHLNTLNLRCSGLLEEKCTCGWYASSIEAPVYTMTESVLVVRCRLYGRVVEHEPELVVKRASLYVARDVLAVDLLYTPRYFRAEYFQPLSAKLFIPKLYHETPHVYRFFQEMIRKKFSGHIELTGIEPWTKTGICQAKYLKTKVEYLCSSSDCTAGSSWNIWFEKDALVGTGICFPCRGATKFSLRSDQIYHAVYGDSNVYDEFFLER